MFADDVRPLVALDWSFSGIHVTFDGREVTRLSGVEELLEQLQDEPHRIVAESTFESWDLARRHALVARVRDEGHELYVYRPIHTARYRKRHGVEKSDVNDAQVIHALAVEDRLHLYPLPEPDPEWVDRVAVANREYQRLRLHGHKPQLAASAAAILGEYRQLPDPARAALGNGSKYSEALLAAVYFAAVRCASRAEFERLLGLHGSAYPTLLRSDVHHHSFRHARNRGVAWPDFRREVRRAYWQIRSAAAERGALTPAAAPPDVTEVTVLARYLLELTFSNGEVRVADVEDLLLGPAFEPLRADYQLFTAVSADVGAGTIVWPTGADLAPEVLYGRSKAAVPA